MLGGIAFPLTASPQAFPLNGGEYATTSTQAFPSTFVEVRPRYYEFRPLVGLEFDYPTGTRRFGYEGHAASARFYEPKILNISEIYKEVPQLWGLYSIGTCTVTLDNSDRYFSILKDTTAFRNRVGWVAMCEPYYGEASIVRIFTGLIDSWVISGGKITFTLHDAMRERFDVPVTQYFNTVNSTLFANMPENQLPRLIPIAFGVQSRDPITWTPDEQIIEPLPAYLVDPAIGQPAYRYIALQHSSAGSFEVCSYGIRKTEGVDYTISTVTIDGYNATYIDFVADQTDYGTHSTDETEVTFGEGGFLVGSTIAANAPLPEYTAPYTPALFVSDLYVLFHEYGIVDITTELDLGMWYDALVYAGARAGGSQLAIIDETLTMKEVLARWCETFLVWLYVNKEGQIALRCVEQVPVLGLTIEKESSIIITDNTNILRNSFSVQSNGEVCSTLQYNYAYNYVGNYFEKQPDLHDATEETNLGHDVRANRNLWYMRDKAGAGAAAEDIATMAMAYMTENTQLVTFNLPIRYHSFVEVTKIVTLSHFEGVATGGLGYDNVSIRVLSVRFRPHPSESEIQIKGIVIP